MFFNCIKNYNELSSKLKSSEKINDDLIEKIRLNEDFENIIVNLKTILNDNPLWLLDIYYINNHVYGMFIERFPLYNNTTMTICTYFLNSNKRLAYASMYKSEHNNSYFIENLYLEMQYEYRKGHGTKLLQQLISIAKSHGAEKIHGILDLRSIIGIDNLRKFYESNGFTTNNDGFYLILK